MTSKTCFIIFLLLCANFSFAQITPISQIKKNDSNGVPIMKGQSATIRGIVTSRNGLFNSTSNSDFYVQDATGGVDIWGAGVPSSVLEGDSVQISGTVDQYNGKTELTITSSNDITIINRNNPLPQPTIITCADIVYSSDEPLEGRLIKIEEVSITSGTWPGSGTTANVTISDGTASVTMRIYSGTNIDGSPQPSGAFDVIAICSQYDNSSPYTSGYQILPRSTSDIIPVMSDVSSVVPLDSKTLLVKFTKTVNKISAENISNYNIREVKSSTTLNIERVVIRSDNKSVLLTTQEQKKGIGYKLYVSNVISTTSDTLSGRSTFIGYDFLPISTVQQDANYDGKSDMEGKTVKVQGVVTIGAGILITGRTSAYIQDNSGAGINIYKSAMDPLIKRGTLIQAEGTVTEYNGVTELANFTYTIIDTGFSLPCVSMLSVWQAKQVVGPSSIWDGTFVQITGKVVRKSFAGGGYNVDVSDGSGTITVRVWGTTGVNLSNVNEGDIYTFRCIGSAYNNAGQLLLGYQEDLIKGTAGSNCNGIGIASISPSIVQPMIPNLSLTVNLVGDTIDVIKVFKIKINQDWKWISDTTAVVLSGSGLSNAKVKVEREFITVKNTFIGMDSSANVTIKGLTSPGRTGIYPFEVWTGPDTLRIATLSKYPTVTVQSEGDVKLKVEPHPFVPEWGEVMPISFSAPSDYRVVLRIFNLEGRLIITLIDANNADEADYIFKRKGYCWNGRNELSEIVPIGVYICHLEAIEPKSGKRLTANAPIVVGTPLK